MEPSEIIERIQKGLKKISERYSIPARDIGINIGKSFGMMGVSLKTTLLNANNEVLVDGKKVVIDIDEVFSVTALESMFVDIRKKLMQMLDSLSDKNSTDKKTTNATIFTRDLEFNPSVSLQEGVKYIKDITVEELTK